MKYMLYSVEWCRTGQPTAAPACPAATRPLPVAFDEDGCDSGGAVGMGAGAESWPGGVPWDTSAPIPPATAPCGMAVASGVAVASRTALATPSCGTPGAPASTPVDPGAGADPADPGAGADAADPGAGADPVDPGDVPSSDVTAGGTAAGGTSACGAWK